MQVFPATFGAKDDQGSLTVFGENSWLKVTRFQRTYTWEESQWDLLIKDIEYMDDEQELVAWPSLILQHVQDNLPNRQVYWIGDGQQRITTVYICLLAIWHSAKDRSIDGGRANWVKELLPDPTQDPSGTFGRLGDVVNGVYRPVVEPKLNFSSERIQKDIKMLVRPLGEDDWITIASRIDDSDESSRLFEAFRKFYDWAEGCELEVLERYTGLVLRDIRLSAVVFAQNENMERAYGNMNSGGKPLTEDELVKARIYNHFKSNHSEELADSMADFWIRELEDEVWWRESGSTAKTSAISRTSAFLGEKYKLENSWKLEAQRHTSQSKNRRAAHWLSNAWNGLLQDMKGNTAATEQFWIDLQKDKLNFEVLRSRDLGSYPKGSAKWLASYANSTIKGAESILLFLMRSIENQEELKRILWLFIRYYLFLKIVANEENFLQLLVKAGSPIYGADLSHDAFLSWFCQMELKAKWLTQDEIESRLKDRVFKNPANSSLTNLFIYVNNRKAEDSRNRESLFSKDTESLDPAKSREHILSQKPKGYENWTEQSKRDHDDLVGRLGNTLIISSTKNSELQNKPVDEKIATYNSEANSLVGAFWVQDFLDDYADAEKVWSIDQIDARSAKLAKYIAPYLAHPPFVQAPGIEITGDSDVTE